MNNWEERAIKGYWEAWDNGSKTTDEMLEFFLSFIHKAREEARIDVLTEIKKEYNEWDCPDEEAMSVCENGSCLDCYLNQRINKSLKEMK